MGIRRKYTHRRGGTPVRIITGTLKGRVLRYPDNNTIRPTMQKTRAAIFDSLGERVRGAVFIDLFAAAGGMGIEAASRGAGFVHFVERDRQAVGALRENLERCGLGPDRCAVHMSDVIDYLVQVPDTTLDDAILFADPPYGAAVTGEIVAVLERKEYHRFSLLIVEHERAFVLESGSPFAIIKSARFGQTHVSFIIPREET